MTEITKARSLLAEALAMSEDDIDEGTSIETCANWDSLAHFRVVAALELALERRLSPMETFELNGLGDVEKLLTK